MKRTLAATALVASMIVVSVTAAFAAQASDRFRLVPEPSQTDTVRVAKSGSTWFTGSSADGRPVTVVFLHRFATVARGGDLVPVSQLRPGDLVVVRGQRNDGRLLAASARIDHDRTAAASTAKAGCCSGSTACASCASGCDNCKGCADCKACCGAEAGGACCTGSACCN